jgi:hypothetical protein
MSSEFFHQNHDDEMFISPKAKELLERIVNSNTQELVQVLKEVYAAKTRITDGQAEISHEEAQLLIQLIEMVRPS